MPPYMPQLFSEASFVYLASISLQISRLSTSMRRVYLPSDTATQRGHIEVLARLVLGMERFLISFLLCSN